MVDRLLYNTVLSQAFSPCGNYLTASNAYGDIAVYSLNLVYNPPEDPRPINGVQHPLHHVKGLEGAHICSLLSTPEFLVAGGIGEIRGKRWKSVTTGKHEKHEKLFKIPLPTLRSEPTDVNSLAYNPINNNLCAGCGDNNIYIFDLEEGRLIKTLTGHTKFIHGIHLSDNQLVSASEDGTVRLWDFRQSAATNIMKPFDSHKLNRPELGKWVGAASLSNDWLLCGGGPRLSLWHLRSMQVTTVFDSITDLKGIHVAKFNEERIFVGGAGPHFYQLGLDGHIHGQIPSSASTVYSAEFQENPQKILSIAGSSMYIDICTNFNYLDQKLTFALQ